MDVEVTSFRPVTTANGARMDPTSSGRPIPPQFVASPCDDRERVVHLAWALAALTNPAGLRSRAPPLMACRCLMSSTTANKRAGRAVATPDPFIHCKGHRDSIQAASSILAPGPGTCQPDR
jgi:hypothetical protein